MVLAGRRERFVVRPEDEGLRLDQLLAARVPGLSRRKARVLLEIGGVFVGGARVKVAGKKLRAGQKVEAELGPALERASKELGAAARARDEAGLPPFSVVFEDDDVCVVDKPAGLLTAPTPESDRQNLASLLSRRPGAPAARVVHRLDLPTSGLLVFAKTDAASRALAERFRIHDVAREYDAVLLGALPEEVRAVDEPVGGRPARTRFEIAERFDERATRVVCRLETGRTHQIRLHAAHVGHPVLGDAEHGRRTAYDPPRMALHARRLGFAHPRTGEPLDFSSPLPSPLEAWLEGLRTRG